MINIENKFQENLNGNKLFRNLYNKEHEASCGKYCKYYISKAKPKILSWAEAHLLQYQIIYYLNKQNFKVKKSDKSAFLKIKNAIIDNAHTICKKDIDGSIISIDSLYE